MRRAAGVKAQGRDPIELGLFWCFFRPLARLVPLIELFDFFQFLERLAQCALGILELNAQFIGRGLRFSRSVVAALARSDRRSAPDRGCLPDPAPP